MASGRGLGGGRAPRDRLGPLGRVGLRADAVWYPLSGVRSPRGYRVPAAQTRKLKPGELIAWRRSNAPFKVPLDLNSFRGLMDTFSVLWPGGGGVLPSVVEGEVIPSLPRHPFPGKTLEFTFLGRVGNDPLAKSLLWFHVPFRK